jgi:hypothetical protein
MKLEFDDGWELHVRIHTHSQGTKKQAKYSIRHTHAHKQTLRSGEPHHSWLCRDIPSLLMYVVKCPLCDDMMPEELHGSMKLISWSVKDADA